MLACTKWKFGQEENMARGWAGHENKVPRQQLLARDEEWGTRTTSLLDHPLSQSARFSVVPWAKGRIWVTFAGQEAWKETTLASWPKWRWTGQVGIPVRRSNCEPVTMAHIAWSPVFILHDFLKITSLLISSIISKWSKANPTELL